MSLHKGMDKYVLLRTLRKQIPEDWRFVWPNTADFNFNYYQLLDRAAQTAIGKSSRRDLRIAVIGTGIAGLTTARELFRSGYVNIDLYEASDRIAGRNYSIPSPDGATVFEMGAMRFPFFTEPGKQNCVLAYYQDLFDITTQPFPDPGSPAAAKTGIYMNNGCGPDPAHPYEKPHMDLWTTGEPPTETLKKIYHKWSHFATLFTTVAEKIYDQGGDAWTLFWDSVIKNYWELNFRDLVYLPAIAKYDESKPGYFGGLGMTDQEAWNFYVIGAGDGGWGAFYDISCLYPIRTLLCGFGTNHQLIQGTFDPRGVFAPGPSYGEPVFDSLGQPLQSPGYLGIQSFSECLFYQPVVSPFVEPISLYQALQSPHYQIRLYTRTPVQEIHRLDRGRVELRSAVKTEAYDAVVVTPTTWALEMSAVFKGFDYSLLPYEAQLSLKQSHWITSCKVFYPLRKRYWGEGSRIPQVMSTDTYLQGIYGYAVETGAIDDAPGVLLLSYTWEDDAIKLEADGDDAALAARCLRELDGILLQCKNIGQPISPYVDESKPVVIHWERQPSYRGCAKLYRERSWTLDHALLTYNQEVSRRSGLCFAGEGYSVEGGWTEPALRSALDAVVHVIRNTGGSFLNGFDFERDYPRYGPVWQTVAVAS